MLEELRDLAALLKHQKIPYSNSTPPSGQVLQLQANGETPGHIHSSMILLPPSGQVL